jgi:ADP-heptose:LPS heptosyltransferase
MKRILKDALFSIFNIAGKIFGKGIERHIDKKRIKKILVIEVGGIGDLIRVFPAIDAIGLNLPDASISILVAKEIRETLELYPGKGRLSEIIDFDLRGLHKGVIRKLPLINLMRKRGYDLIYAPARGEGAREISLMSFLTGAQYRIGFRLDDINGFHTSSLRFREDIPILKQNLELLERSGISITNERVNIKIPEKDLKDSDKLINQSSTSNLIVIHPATARHLQYRMWSTERYASLIKEILKEYNSPVILIGSREDEETGHRICALINHPSLSNLIGKTSIPLTAAIIKRSQLFIGNDSGPLHIALALNIPSVAIFGPTSPMQVLSEEYRNRCHIVSSNVDCSPCYLHMEHRIPSCKSVKCMGEISVDEVLRAVKIALKRDQACTGL